MFTLGLAWIDSKSDKDFALLYWATFFIDIAMWDSLK